MSILSSFFKRDNVKAFLNIAFKILKMVAGGTANTLHTVAQEEVAKAEKVGGNGTNKYEIAYNGIKSRLPEVGESAINLALELCVSALSQKKG